MAPKATYLLTGDIGGTNSRMSLYSISDEKHLVYKEFRNEEALPPSTRSDPAAFQKYIVIPFLEHCWETASTKLVPLQDCQIIACLATAGLVTANGVRMTNLDDLLVDGTAIANNSSDPYLKQVLSCLVINDFVAQGYGVLTLKQNEVRVLHGPVSSLDSLPLCPKVCVGAGTGLGECYLTPNYDGSYSCFPSEGGHAEYAPRNALEVKLREFLSAKFESRDRISVERVVSGTGLANVYDFLSTHIPPSRVVDPVVHQKFLTAGDKQGEVVAVNAKPGTLCGDAIDIMMAAYGCEVGSAAIKWIPTGGLFVTGGVTPKNINHIEGKDTHFMKSYLNKGRVSPLLESIPLFAVMVEDLGVRGARKAALMEYERFSSGKSDTTSKKQSMNELVSWPLAIATVLGFSAGVLFHKPGVLFHKLRH